MTLVSIVCFVFILSSAPKVQSTDDGRKCMLNPG